MYDKSLQLLKMEIDHLTDSVISAESLIGKIRELSLELEKRSNYSWSNRGAYTGTDHYNEGCIFTAEKISKLIKSFYEQTET